MGTKLFSLALLRIWGQLRKHKLIMVLFFLGILLSNLIFLYFYGNFSNSKINQASRGASYKSFLLEFNEPTEVDEAAYHCLDEFGVADVMVAAKAEIEEAMILPETKSEVGRFQVRAYLYNRWNLENTLPLFEQEGETGDLLICSKIYPAKSVFRINGIDFQIKDKLDNLHTSYFYIPLPAFRAHGFLATEMQYFVSQTPTKEEIKSIEAILEAKFPHTTIISPTYNYALDRKRDMVGTVQNSIFYLLSILSSFFLFSYLLEEGAYENAIFLVAGARKGTVFAVLFLEIMLLCGFSAVCASLLHQGFYTAFFDKINAVPNIPYYFVDYLLAFLLSFFLACLAALPFLLHYCRKTGMQLKNKYQI